MNEIANPRWLVWTGRIISGLVVFAFTMSAIMKFVGGEQVDEGMKHLGLPKSMVIPLGILELTCAIIYLIPQTSVLGAILLAGYMGGAICTHWRVGDDFVTQIVLGVLAWLGIYCRDARLRALIPWRTQRRALSQDQT